MEDDLGQEVVQRYGAGGVVRCDVLVQLHLHALRQLHQRGVAIAKIEIALMNQKVCDDAE